MAENYTKAPSRRACDSCHHRKVKCVTEGTTTCKHCVSTGLACTYNAITRNKNSKPRSGKVLAQLREIQRKPQLLGKYPTDPGFDGRSLPATSAPTQGLLPPSLVRNCIEYFFSHVYSSEPVLHHQRAQEAANKMYCCRESYCMIVALCAYVMIKANYNPPTSVILPEMAHMSNIDIGQRLLEESVSVRQVYGQHEASTHMSVLTSWFYSGCYFGLDQEKTAWIYIREAATYAQLLGMHNEETYKHDSFDASGMRVLYWLLFIAERTYALRIHQPIILRPSIRPLQSDKVPFDQSIAFGLNVMINLFAIIDDTFINLRNKAVTDVSDAWILHLHKLLSEAVPASLECYEAQKVQIRITQQWLRLQTWQLSVCQGFVNNDSKDAPLTFKYPIKIARDLLTISNEFSRQSMEVYGVDLTRKLFDIAYRLIRVAACTPFLPESFALEPQDYEWQLLNLISPLRQGQTRYVPLLLAELPEFMGNGLLVSSLNLPYTVL